MTKSFYFKMAGKNIANNRSGYLPYMIASILTIAMYYIMEALARNGHVLQVYGGEAIQSVLAAGSGILAIFSVIFLFYTYSFLVKRRKKEFGVFNILGMEKKHISVIMFLESVYVAAATLAAGLVTGIVFSKLFFWIFMRLLGARIALEWSFSAAACARTALLFGVIFLLSYLNTLRQIHLSNPIELLRGGQVGEREPKTKGFLALVSFACLAAGYYLAVTTEDPVASITIFFVAAILVVLGTYGLFTVGSILILKLLRRNKKYYYKTQHFISVSGMIYRMKQNAVGLANICILSSAVLVLVSTTASLYLGMNDLIANRYPKEISMQIYVDHEGAEQQMDDLIAQKLQEYGITPKDESKYHYISVVTAYDNGKFYSEEELDSASASILSRNIVSMEIIPAHEAREMGADVTELGDREAAVYEVGGSLEDDSFTVNGQEYQVVQRLETLDVSMGAVDSVSDTLVLVVKDLDAVKTMASLFMGHEIGEPSGGESQERGSAMIQADTQNTNERIRYTYDFNTDADEDAQAAFMQAVQAEMRGDEGSSQNPEWTALNGYIEGRAGAEESFYSLYGSLFFIGMLLGAVFLMATALIIYYKQISEGYEDRERFAIMQKVGLSRREVHRSIKSQVLTVFYLPLVMAGIHIAFAFPLLRKVMALMNLTNTGLFLRGCALTYVIFAVIYAAIYALTARSYYKIVS